MIVLDFQYNQINKGFMPYNLNKLLAFIVGQVNGTIRLTIFLVDLSDYP